jgi:hypothetical protein
MPLFRKSSGGDQTSPSGSWYPDPFERFDARLMVSRSMSSADWSEHVRLGADGYLDPLPPDFTVSWADDIPMMQSRVRSTLISRAPRDQLKSLSKSTSYVGRKIDALLALAAPNFPATRRDEFEGMLAGAMTISGNEYLEQFSANRAFRDAFEILAKEQDPNKHVAWFWDIDLFFQAPHFHDDLIFRIGQLILRNMEASERPLVGRPFPN